MHKSANAESNRHEWIEGLRIAAAIATLPVCGAYAADSGFTAYALRMNFSNVVCTVTGGPNTVSNSPFIENALVLKTDGNGQISGSGWLWVDYSNAPYSAFLVDATGKISSTTAHRTPIVTMNLNGPGYTLDGHGGSTANSIHLKFSGQPGPNPVDTSQTGIVGKLTGSIAGTTPLGEKSAVVNFDTVITDVDFTPLTLVAQVQQDSKRMLLFNAVNVDFNGNGRGNPIFDLTGTGQINSSGKTYRFTAKGIGIEKGWNLVVSGNLATQTSSVVSGVTFSAPVSAQVSGKVQGQAISGSTTDIQAELVPGN